MRCLPHPALCHTQVVPEGRSAPWIHTDEGEQCPVLLPPATGCPPDTFTACTRAAGWELTALLRPERPQLDNMLCPCTCSMHCGTWCGGRCRRFCSVLDLAYISPVRLPAPAAGPDDMPAHCKSSMLGSSVSIPITNGR